MSARCGTINDASTSAGLLTKESRERILQVLPWCARGEADSTVPYPLLPTARELRPKLEFGMMTWYL